MKRYAVIALVLALGLTPPPATSQQFAEGFGDIYLTTEVSVDPFDWPLGPISTCIEDPGLAPFSTLEFFLVVRLDFGDIGRPDLNVSNGFRGWEVEVDIPPQLTITARTRQPQPPLSINVGDDAADNYIVGLSNTVLARETPFAVVEYSSILLAAAQNVQLTLGPPQPSSFDVVGGPGPIPGWLEGLPTGDCLSSSGNPRECLRPFSRWKTCDNKFWINYTGNKGCLRRCVVATQETTWGAIKSRF